MLSKIISDVISNRFSMERAKLFNPFVNYTTRQLFTFGVGVTLLGSCVAYLLNARFDGVLDMHVFAQVMAYQPLIDNLINSFFLCIPLCLLGKLVNRKTRFVDILNAVLVSRTPIYLLPLFNIGDGLYRSTSDLLHRLQAGGMGVTGGNAVLIGFFGLLALLALVVYLVLLFNGFRVATNSKAWWHVPAFMACVLLGEVLSKAFIFRLAY